MSADILIVDDEADIRDLVAGILQDEGYDARTARNSDDALAAITSRKPNLVFLDIWLQGSRLDGLQLLDAVKQDHPDRKSTRQLQSRQYLVCRLLLEKKKKRKVIALAHQKSMGDPAHHAIKVTSI